MVARSLCEQRDWLVAAPTFARVTVDATGAEVIKRGLGLYRVGSDEPLDLPDLASSQDRYPPLARKASKVAPHDTKRYVAIGLGSAGAVAMAVGAVLFAGAFKSNVDANGREQQKIDGSRAAWGAGTVGLGFGLGIAGLVVNPSYGDRTRANASRYLFAEEEDQEEQVRAFVKRHNQRVRAHCAKSATLPAAAPAG